MDGVCFFFFRWENDDYDGFCLHCSLLLSRHLGCLHFLRDSRLYCYHIWPNHCFRCFPMPLRWLSSYIHLFSISHDGGYCDILRLCLIYYSAIDSGVGCLQRPLRFTHLSFHCYGLIPTRSISDRVSRLEILGCGFYSYTTYPRIRLGVSYWRGCTFCSPGVYIGIDIQLVMCILFIRF